MYRVYNIKTIKKYRYLVSLFWVYLDMKVTLVWRPNLTYSWVRLLGALWKNFAFKCSIPKIFYTILCYFRNLFKNEFRKLIIMILEGSLFAAVFKDNRSLGYTRVADPGGCTRIWIRPSRKNRIRIQPAEKPDPTLEKYPGSESYFFFLAF